MASNRCSHHSCLSLVNFPLPDPKDKPTDQGDQAQHWGFPDQLVQGGPEFLPHQGITFLTKALTVDGPQAQAPSTHWLILITPPCQSWWQPYHLHCTDGETKANIFPTIKHSKKMTESGFKPRANGLQKPHHFYYTLHQKHPISRTPGPNGDLLARAEGPRSQGHQRHPPTHPQLPWQTCQPRMQKSGRCSRITKPPEVWAQSHLLGDLWPQPFASLSMGSYSARRRARQGTEWVTLL